MGNLGPGGREEGNAGIRVGDVLARGYRQGILVQNFVRAEEGGKVSTIILGGREVRNLVGGRAVRNISGRRTHDGWLKQIDHLMKLVLQYHANKSINY